MVGNMRKRKRGKKRQRKRRKPSPWLWKTFLNSLRKMPRGSQVKRDGLAITVERRGISSGIALRHLSCPRLHVQSAKDHTGREIAPRGVGLWGWTLKTIRTEGPHTSSHPNYTWGTPGINNCGEWGQSVNFLLDTGATYSVLTEALAHFLPNPLP